MKLFVRDKQFYRKALVLAVPVTLQSVINIGVNMVDTIMVGKFGEAQLSGASQANQFVMLFHILCMGMGMGAAVMTSQFWGRQDIPSLKKVISIMLRICVAISLVFTIAGFFFPHQILRIYSPEAAIIENGAKYLKIVALTFIMMGLSTTITLVLRTVNSVRVPLISSIAAFFINIFFNWVFMFGKLGAPRLEIVGAAIGTLISRIVELVIILGYFLVVEKKIHYRVKDFFMKCSDLIKSYVHYSVPVIISDLLLALGNNIVAIVMGHIGSSFVSANTITMVTVQISTVFIQGMSNASCVITGQTLGEGRADDAFNQGITFTALSAIIGVLAGLLITAISPFIISFYEITEETRAIAQELMIAVAFIVVFQSIGSVMTKGVLRGGGDTKFLMVADVLFLWVASVSLGMLAAFVFHWSPFVIYTFLKIDHILKSIWCFFRMKSRKWIKII